MVKLSMSETRQQQVGFLLWLFSFCSESFLSLLLWLIILICSADPYWLQKSFLCVWNIKRFCELPYGPSAHVSTAVPAANPSAGVGAPLCALLALTTAGVWDSHCFEIWGCTAVRCQVCLTCNCVWLAVCYVAVKIFVLCLCGRIVNVSRSQALLLQKFGSIVHRTNVPVGGQRAGLRHLTACSGWLSIWGQLKTVQTRGEVPGWCLFLFKLVYFKEAYEWWGREGWWLFFFGFVLTPKFVPTLKCIAVWWGHLAWQHRRSPRPILGSFKWKSAPARWMQGPTHRAAIPWLLACAPCFAREIEKGKKPSTTCLFQQSQYHPWCLAFCLCSQTLIKKRLSYLPRKQAGAHYSCVLYESFKVVTMRYLLKL